MAFYFQKTYRPEIEQRLRGAFPFFRLGFQQSQV